MGTKRRAEATNGIRVATRNDWPCNSQTQSQQSNTSNTVIKFVFVPLYFLLCLIVIKNIDHKDAIQNVIHNGIDNVNLPLEWIYIFISRERQLDGPS